MINKLNNLANNHHPQKIEEYEVEQILSRKYTKNGLMYKIKWRGFDLSQSTWEPLKNLQRSLQAVKQFQNQVKQINREKKQTYFQRMLKRSNQDGKKKKKFIFKSHLIFPKPKAIKIQNKKQPKEQQNCVAINANTKKKGVRSRKNKGYLQQCQQFQIVIDKQAESIIEQPDAKNPQQQKQCQIQQKAYNFFVDQQDDPVLPHDHTDNRMNIFDEQSSQYDENINEPLDLSKLQQQQQHRLTLKHLNPDEVNYIPMSSAQALKNKLLVNIIHLGKSKIIDEKDPCLISKDLVVSKIVNFQDKWMAELKLKPKQQIHGYVSIQTLQKLNLQIVLDYLADLIPK